MSKSDIIDKYCIVENGRIEKGEYDIICQSEDDLLDNLIDFSSYLEKLVAGFNDKKLPFSSGESAENKITLSQTFIDPGFSVGKGNNEVECTLKEHVDNWLGEDTEKHLVLLGGYGMGKSSCTKYYASSLAKEILSGNKVKRIPILISLTNTSPRHGGIDNAIARFLAENVGVSIKVFYELVYRGKIVFILDGFDEMGFVGTHEQRVKQLNAIWKLATKKNKILISGRPSYFPNDEELKYVFNIKEDSKLLPPQDSPFFERLNLLPFDKSKIEESISRHNYTKEEALNYFEFIENNASILELCKRPSLMHIVREMLPVLFNSYEKEQWTAGILMNSYIDHWLERQLNKDVVSAIEDKKTKKKFIMDFFKDLSVEYYVNDLDSMPSYDVLQFLKQSISNANHKLKASI